jgi:hypothetical protein
MTIQRELSNTLLYNKATMYTGSSTREEMDIHAMFNC